MATAKLLGASIKRREDPRFITGKGHYTDDLTLPGMTYAAFVRSPHAFAGIKKIDTSKALKHPGVVAVFTGKDMTGVNSLPCGWLLPDLKVPPHMPLASDAVRYVGDPVAIVIAESQTAALDAAELVAVDWDVKPSVTRTDKAAAKGAPAIHAVAPDNVAFRWQIGDAAATEAAFKSAAVTVKKRIVNQRLVANALEPRACVARYEDATGDWTLWVTSQNPHVHRLLMTAFVLGIPEHKVRVIAPDVGGGFGSKIFLYNEETVCTWATKQIKRPIRWTSSRREAFQTDAHGRDHVTDAEVAVSRDGKFLGLRVKTTANLGAYLSTFAPAVPTYLYATLLNGVYEWPAIHAEVTGVFTNTTPVDAYRGAGRPEATYVLERMVDLAAQELSMDPLDVRSGNYAGALHKALGLFDYAAFRKEQQAARKQGRYLGVGFSTYVEACGLAPSQVAGALGAQAGLYESATVRVHPTGKVTVFTGSRSHGQGHETTFAQVAADELGLPMEDIEIVHGDTGQVPFGMGTYGSRSGPVGASAIHMGLQKIKEKGKKIAAHLLEASENDVVYEGGKFSVKGSPNRFKTFGDVALMAYLAHNLPKGLEPGLEAISFFDPGNFVFPFGTHIAVVEVERETGKVKLVRYIAVDDLGRVINPMIVDGMVQGGIVQGVAQALWEEAIYDENGQLVTGSMMNYALPKADDD